MYVCACAFGVLEVHSSTDTWIALAAGREIVSKPYFPKTDTFSYTFYGQTWFNQNWLSHVLFWVLYDRLSPGAVVVGTWLLGAAIFGFILLATRLRCGSWLGATVAASLVAMASRDWLSARPATIQFLLLALEVLCFSALLSQSAQRRWWPILLLLPVFAVWTHAHGSFVFGYALVAMFLVCTLLPRAFGAAPVLSAAQVATLLAIVLVTAVLGAVLSPYGLENYTHPLKVAESKVFRQIGEWTPPYRWAEFPTVSRFWITLVIAVTSPLLAWLLAAMHRRGLAHHAVRLPQKRYLTPFSFDVACVGVGLAMALWARRFAPLFYLLATPAVVTWTLHWAGVVPARVRERVRLTVAWLAWPAAVAIAGWTLRVAHEDLVKNFRTPPEAHYDLFQRAMRYDQCPALAIEFLRRNRLTPNIWTEWTQGGVVVFLAPGAHVFIDGRSQQLYTEAHYRNYGFCLKFRDEDEAKMPLLLEMHGTEAVLLRRAQVAYRMASALDRAPDWRLVLSSKVFVFFVRRDSPLMDALLRRERAGQLWWPNVPESDWLRGTLWVEREPRDFEKAVSYWQSAVLRSPALGWNCYARIVGALAKMERFAQATEYLERERQKLSARLPGLSEEIRTQLLQEIDRCASMLADYEREPAADGGG